MVVDLDFWVRKLCEFAVLCGCYSGMLDGKGWLMLTLVGGESCRVWV